MENATETGTRGESDIGVFTVYADFNCPFCYALNERLRELNLEQRIDFRPIQHAPAILGKQVGFEELRELTREVAEVRRQTGPLVSYYSTRTTDAQWQHVVHKWRFV